MDKKMDYVVKVVVTDALAQATPSAVNTVALVGGSEDGSDVGIMYSTDDIAETYGEDSELHVLSKSFFGENNPGKVACVPFDWDSDDIEKVLNSALEAADLYHFVIRAPRDTSAEELVTLATKLNSWCSANYRFAHLESQDFDKAIDALIGLNELKPARVAIYYHDEPLGYSLAAAIVADRCAVDPARGTWAHKSLKTVTPDKLKTAQFAQAKNNGLNVLTSVAGVARLFFGTAGASTKYIDSQIKKDWIKFRTAEEIYNLLGSANGNYGVEYDDGGIQSVGAAVNKILTQANGSTRRYIMDNSWDVTVPLFADIEKAQVEKRNLPDIRATFSIMQSIHTVEQVDLIVVL